MAAKFLGKFWFLIPMIGLVFAVLWLRGSLADAKSDARAAETRVEELNSANASLEAIIGDFRQQRVDNDAIAEAVAARMGGNVMRETNTRTIIERAVENDPATRDWASVPVPSSVREGLRAPSDTTPPG